MPMSLASSPFSKASMDWCTAVGSRKISVDPHQIMTTRSTVFLNARMSALTWSARSRLFLPFFTCVPLRRLT